MNLTAITLANVDPTTADEDVIADAITGAMFEVYPDDADPAWVTPTGAVVIAPEVLALILDAAIVGLEGCEEPHAEAAFHAVTTLRANRPEGGA